MNERHLSIDVEPMPELPVSLHAHFAPLADLAGLRYLRAGRETSIATSTSAVRSIKTISLIRRDEPTTHRSASIQCRIPVEVGIAIWQILS
jgi:hypothetical protein